MKRKNALISFLTICTIFFPNLLEKAFSQDKLLGIWKGTFMDQFQVELLFERKDQGFYNGNIIMYADEQMVQNDQIVDISKIEDTVRFFIPSKNTNFKGRVSKPINELSGNFIFPDGTMHPILLTKSLEKSDVLKRFNIEYLHQDLEFIYTNLKKYHPQVFSHTSRDAMDLIVDNVKDKINAPLTINEFYFFASEITDNIHCSHTGIRLPETYRKRRNTRVEAFPLQLYFMDGKAFYIPHDAETSSPILPGSEIISINNLPVENIVDTLFFLIPAEGQNISTKYNILNNNFNELYPHLDKANEFLVEFKNGDNLEKTIVSSISNKRLKTEAQENRNTKILNFEMLENEELGILKIPSFAIPNMEEYLQELDRVFRFLKSNGVQDLIVDLRDNAGGHPIFAAQLLSYLTNQNFTYFKRNEEVVEFEPLYNPMNPNTLNFQGKLYVFVNGGCLSTTGHLISLLAYHTNAKFIGEQPGSTYRCNDKSVQLICPITKLELNVPTTTFTTPAEQYFNLHPFHLDYKISNSIFDIFS